MAGGSNLIRFERLGYSYGHRSPVVSSNGYDPRQNLQIILQGNANTKTESALNALYRTALDCRGRDMG